jgi:hypothetical protein
MVRKKYAEAFVVQLQNENEILDRVRSIQQIFVSLSDVTYSRTLFVALM